MEGPKEPPMRLPRREFREVAEGLLVDAFVRELMKATAPDAPSEEVRGLLVSLASAARRALSRALCETEPPLTHSPSSRWE